MTGNINVVKPSAAELLFYGAEHVKALLRRYNSTPLF